MGDVERAEELERAAEELYWAGDHEGSIAATERALALYQQEGNNRRAGLMAVLLSHRAGETGGFAVGAGWHQKAATLLANEPDCEEKAWFLAFHANAMKWMGDVDTAREIFDEADRIASAVGSKDVHAYVMSCKGGMLALNGEVADGVALIDEAMAGAITGEMSRLAGAYCFCYMLDACQRIGDFGRATEWIEQARRSAGSEQIIGFPGDCRIRYAAMLRMQGSWTDALAEAEQACRETEHWPARRGDAFFEIGMLKLCSDDLKGAEEAFQRAHSAGREPQPGLALLCAARGDAEGAARSITASLDVVRPGDDDPSELLAAAAEITAAVGDFESAERAVAQLREVEQKEPTQIVRARMAYARGAIAVAQGASADALSFLTTALEVWRDVGAPYDLARTRLLLAEAYRRAGDAGRAVLEIGAARETFERLGAKREEQRAAKMLDSAVAKGRVSGLTARELEVLRLVAAGRTNKEIAAELVVSVATVERHVANIYRKIGVRSRVEATAYALGRSLV